MKALIIIAILKALTAGAPCEVIDHHESTGRRNKATMTMTTTAK